VYRDGGLERGQGLSTFVVVVDRDTELPAVLSLPGRAEAS